MYRSSVSEPGRRDHREDDCPMKGYCSDICHQRALDIFAALLKKRQRTPLLWALPAISGLFLYPESAFALQVHPTPEGLYAHQISHAFLVFSMAILVFWLQKRRLVQERGWRYIQVSCLLFILWNIDAMTGHVIDSKLDAEAFTATGFSRALVMEKAITPYLYYLLKLDHFICVPAIVFLYLGLRRLEFGAKEK